MCDAHILHPNDIGYWVIARAIATAVADAPLIQALASEHTSPFVGQERQTGARDS